MGSAQEGFADAREQRMLRDLDLVLSERRPAIEGEQLRVCEVHMPCVGGLIAIVERAIDAGRADVRPHCVEALRQPTRDDERALGPSLEAAGELEKNPLLGVVDSRRVIAPQARAIELDSTQEDSHIEYLITR